MFPRFWFVLSIIFRFAARPHSWAAHTHMSWPTLLTRFVELTLRSKAPRKNNNWKRFRIYSQNTWSWNHQPRNTARFSLCPLLFRIRCDTHFSEIRCSVYVSVSSKSINEMCFVFNVNLSKRNLHDISFYSYVFNMPAMATNWLGLVGLKKILGVVDWFVGFFLFSESNDSFQHDSYKFSNWVHLDKSETSSITMMAN